MKISIVIPAHNEELNILNLTRKIEAFLDIEHELVIVDDHSNDRTKELTEQLSKEYNNIRLIENKLEQGFANAIKTGYKNKRSDIVVPIMGDLCDDLSTVDKMLAKINEGYDIVCGSRYIKGGSRVGGSKLKGLLSKSAGWLLYYLLGIPTHDVTNAFKMYRKSVLDTINTDSKSFEISMEIPLKAYFAGFKITEVPTVWKERTKGKSSFKIFKKLPVYIKLFVWAISKKMEI